MVALMKNSKSEILNKSLYQMFKIQNSFDHLDFGFSDSNLGFGEGI